MGMEADWRRRIMTKDGAAIMERVGLERRQMRRFGEFHRVFVGRSHPLSFGYSRSFHEQINGNGCVFDVFIGNSSIDMN
jgi:hypothetical protein